MPKPLTPDERHARGQQARKLVPRSSHSELKPKQSGRNALEILRKSMKGRVPRLIALKYERMAASPFAYFRGAVPVMAYDLGHQPDTGIINQICGDAHVRNLGAYAGLDGRLVFDINDFDETICGPFEWDVKRLATSIILAGRETQVKESKCRDAAEGFLRRYRKSIHIFAAMPILELARYQIHRQMDLAAVAQVLEKAERSTPLRSLDSLTEPGKDQALKHAPASKAAKGSRASAPAAKGAAASKSPARPESRRFRSNPPILERLSATEAAKVLASLTSYAQTLHPERRHFLAGYRPVDVAFKVVGIGSVGLRDYCIYLEGNGSGDPLFLQVKEEAPSAWLPYLPARKRAGTAVASHSATTVKHEGKRVVEGQRAMQLQSDPFLGYTNIEGADYLVRQLNDHKGSVNLGELTEEALCHFADLCGELLARGHARSGDPVALAGYIGHGDRFDDAITRFARGYADQTERDWKELKRWLKK